LSVLAIGGQRLGIVMKDGSKWLMMHAAPASLTQEIVYSWWPIASGVSVIGALLGALHGKQ
jgi:putative ABC transport system permease protein